MTMLQPDTRAQRWRCQACDRELGLVINNKLYVAGWQLISGTIVCRSCGHRQTWIPPRPQREQAVMR
jgi:hypothetical protein